MFIYFAAVVSCIASYSLNVALAWKVLSSLRVILKGRRVLNSSHFHYWNALVFAPLCVLPRSHQLCRWTVTPVLTPLPSFHKCFISQLHFIVRAFSDADNSSCSVARILLQMEKYMVLHVHCSLCVTLVLMYCVCAPWLSIQSKVNTKYVLAQL